MVAPVMQQGAVSREITFPEGTWVDFNHPERRYAGHTTVNYSAPLEVLPLFVRAGAFIPQACYEMNNVGDYNPDKLDIIYYASDYPSTFTLFDDDLHSTGTLARDKHRLINFTATPQGKHTTITIQGRGNIDGDAPGKDYRIIIPATNKPGKVTINGKKAQGVAYDKRTRTLTIPIAIPDVTATTIIELTK